MKAVFRLIEYDFKNFFRYKWWLVGLISMNLADLFIMAIVYNEMVNPALLGQIREYFMFFCCAINTMNNLISRPLNIRTLKVIHIYQFANNFVSRN